MRTRPEPALDRSAGRDQKQYIEERVEPLRNVIRSSEDHDVAEEKLVIRRQDRHARIACDEVAVSVRLGNERRFGQVIRERIVVVGRQNYPAPQDISNPQRDRDEHYKRERVDFREAQSTKRKQRDSNESNNGDREHRPR